MNTVIGWVKSILLFGIFSSVLLNLSPNKSYEKHISIAVGMIFILLIINPVTKFRINDSDAYMSYIKNYIIADKSRQQISDGARSLYEDSIRIQLEEAFYEAGYPVKRVKVFANDEGEVYKLSISFRGEVSNLAAVEAYVNSIFENGVLIEYE